MNSSLLYVQDVFLDKINRICGKFGLNNIMAQLYTILYFQDGPMSLDEMTDRLKISKASASINIRALERYGVVRKVWVKGSRKDHYAAEGDISKVIIERANAMAKSRLSEIGQMVKSSYEALDAIDGGLDDSKAGAFRRKLDSLKALHEKAQGLFELFNAGLTAAMGAAGAESAVREEAVCEASSGAVTRQG